MKLFSVFIIFGFATMPTVFAEDASTICHVNFSRVIAPEFTPNGTGFTREELNEIKKTTTHLATSLTTTKEDLRAQLLCIALLIDPDYKQAYIANLSLADRKLPPAISNTNISESMLKMPKITFNLGRKARTESGIKMVGMLLEACSNIDKNNNKILAAHRQFFTRHTKPNWNYYLNKKFNAPGSEKPLALIRDAKPNASLEEDGIQLWRTRAKINTLMFAHSNQKKGPVTPFIVEAIYTTYNDTPPGSGNLTFVDSYKDTNNSGLPEVASLMEVRHNALLSRGCVTFHLSDTTKTKDGHSASLACSLLLESLFSGVKLADDCSCIGSVNSDGTVQTIAGVVERLKVARQGGTPVVLLPEGNKYALHDLAVLGDARILSRVQALTVSNFDQALEIAKVDRSNDIHTSITDFAYLQEEFDKKGVMTVLKQSSTQSTLLAILERTPNHASAQVMNDVINRTLPKTLSLNSSVDELFKSHLSLVKVLNNLEDSASDLGPIMKRLKFLGPRVEPRTRKLATVLYQMSFECWKHLANPNSQMVHNHRVKEIMKLAGAVIKELENISQDPELIEELDL